MMPAKKHVHKYHKVDLSYQKVWACAFGNCTHYMPKHLEFNMNGRPSICWNCGQEFELNIINMQSDKPVCCSDCSSGTPTSKIMEILANLEGQGK